MRGAEDDAMQVESGQDNARVFKLGDDRNRALHPGIRDTGARRNEEELAVHTRVRER